MYRTVRGLTGSRTLSRKSEWRKGSEGDGHRCTGATSGCLTCWTHSRTDPSIAFPFFN